VCIVVVVTLLSLFAQKKGGGENSYQCKKVVSENALPPEVGGNALSAGNCKFLEAPEEKKAKTLRWLQGDIASQWPSTVAGMQGLNTFLQKLNASEDELKYTAIQETPPNYQFQVTLCGVNVSGGLAVGKRKAQNLAASSMAAIIACEKFPRW